MLTLASKSLARAEVPPNLSTMSDAVMAYSLAENASQSQAVIANLSNAVLCALRQNPLMLGSKEILAALERRNIPKTDIAKTLGVDPSQVTRLFTDDPNQKPRHLKHDEAVILVTKYGLEPDQGPKPLPPAVWRLVAHHIASRLQLPLEEDDPRLVDLVGDLAAFSRFVRHRQVQGLVQAAENFFEVTQSRRELEEEDLPENHPQPAR